MKDPKLIYMKYYSKFKRQYHPTNSDSHWLRQIDMYDFYHINYGHIFSRFLCIFYEKDIHDWYDPELFDWNQYKYLFDYCMDYKDLWYDDYLLRKII